MHTHTHAMPVYLKGLTTIESISLVSLLTGAMKLWLPPQIPSSNSNVSETSTPHKRMHQSCAASEHLGHAWQEADLAPQALHCCLWGPLLCPQGQLVHLETRCLIWRSTSSSENESTFDAAKNLYDTWMLTFASTLCNVEARVTSKHKRKTSCMKERIGHNIHQRSVWTRRIHYNNPPHEGAQVVLGCACLLPLCYNGGLLALCSIYAQKSIPVPNVCVS